MKIQASLLFASLVPFLARGSILSRLGQSVRKGVTHFEQQIAGSRLQSHSSGEASGGKPAYCNGLDCPEFKVIKKEKDWELREYVPTTWVSTNTVGIDFKPAQTDNFMRLFEYISGENEKKEKIDMTAPVIDLLIPGPGPACESNFTMSFFVSPSVAAPPAPSNKAVFFTRMNKMRVYVRYFSGFTRNEQVWVDEAAKLAKDLIKAGEKFEDKYYYTAGYDSPFKFLNRHNEIWFMPTP